METLATEFTVGEKTYKRDLSGDLFIDQGDINSSFVDHAQKFAWYATIYELCSDYESKLKNELGRLEAQLDYEVRMEFEGASLKATEAKVKNTIITRPDYVKAQEALREAALNTGLAKAARDSMMHRKDMLVGLGANYRAEGMSDLSLKTDQLKK